MPKHIGFNKDKRRIDTRGISIDGAVGNLIISSLTLTETAVTQLQTVVLDAGSSITGGTITSSTIDSTIIGGTTSAAGTFSSLSSTSFNTSGGEFTGTNIGLALTGTSGNYGGGTGVVFIQDAATNPTSNPTLGGLLYVDGNVLNYRDTSGTITDLTAGGSGGATFISTRLTNRIFDANWTTSVTITFADPTLTVSGLTVGITLGKMDSIEASTSDRILIREAGLASGGAAANDAYNGIWEVTGGTTTSLTMTRTTDYDTTAEILVGVPIYVEEGITYATSTHVLTTIAAITVNTTALTYEVYSMGVNNTFTSRTTSFGYNSINFATLTGSTSRNTAFGANAGSSLTNGNLSTFIGYNAGSSVTSGQDNVFVGDQAGENVINGNSNTFIGTQAGETATTASDNVCIGDTAGASLTTLATSSDNIMIGSASGTNNVGNDNIMIGSLTGGSSTGVDRCVFIGDASGRFDLIGDDNIFLGYRAGMRVTGAQNIYIGSNAGVTTGNTGVDNVIMGYNAGTAINGAANQNVILGSTAGDSLTVGDDNVFIGYNTGGVITLGVSNVFIGSAMGSTTAGGLFVTDSNKLIIGNTDGVALIGGEFNNDNLAFCQSATVVPTNYGASTAGVGCIFIANATTAPVGGPTGGGILFVESGALKFLGSSGTVTTIAIA